MNKRPDWHDWDEQINALLDGELSDGDAEQLKNAASSDQALAAAIIEAYQLQRALTAIPQQRAPDSLRRKLANIPQEQQRLGQTAPASWWAAWWRKPPTWAATLAAIPLVVIAVTQLGPKEPSPEEIAQAQQELIVALTYLGKVSRKTRLEIGDTVNGEMQKTVNENMIQTIHEQLEFNKERNT